MMVTSMKLILQYYTVLLTVGLKERIWLSQKELIMEKYKIVSTMVEHLDKGEADETLRQLQLQNPDKKLEVLRYNWSTVEKRYGRDPDLH